jgi:acyl-CoA thioester hydrolase
MRDDTMEDGKTVVKEPSSTAIIRFQDCDPFGHLYNARYIDYFVNAREDHLAQFYGLDIYERQKKLNENWLITKHQIAYMSPVAFREEVLIKTCLLNFTENSLLMEGLMLNTKLKRLNSVIWTRFKYFSFTKGRPIQHSEDMMKFFEGIRAGSDVDFSDFDQRVHALRSGYS